MADDKDDKGQPGGSKGQGDKDDKDDKTAQDDKAGKGEGEKESFTQEEVNSLLAAERRKEQAKAAQFKRELDALKTKDLPEAQQHKLRAEALEQDLARYKARELAETVADDLKIPKAEQAKYLRYITATNEAEIKEQLKQLRKDFGANSTGAGSNPARTGKPGKHDSINRFIRNRGKSEV